MPGAYRSTTIDSVHISVWARGASREDIAALEREFDELADARDESVGVLMVIPNGTSLPDEGARKRSGLMIERARIRRLIVIIEGGGFWASAMRSVFAGLGILYRPGFEWTVKPSVADGVAWLDMGLDPAEVRARADALRPAS